MKIKEKNVSFINEEGKILILDCNGYALLIW